MKFACPKCSTRYTIGDDKVPAGKAVRFPCKKCGNVIRLRRKQKRGRARPRIDVAATKVASSAELDKLRSEARGSASSRPAQTEDVATKVASIAELDQLRDSARGPENLDHLETRIASVGDIAKALSTPDARNREPTIDGDQDWFFLVGGKQQGPVHARQLLSMLEHKEVDKRTYIWRDGMDEWKRLGTVPEFTRASEKAGSAAWRIIAPTDGDLANDGGPTTVAMDVSQLRQQLAKSRDDKLAESSPAQSEPIDGVESIEDREATPINDPVLIGALSGQPTGERLSRSMEEETPEVLGTPSLGPDLVGLSEVTEEPIENGLEGLGPSFSQAATGDEGRPLNPEYVNAPPGESTKFFMATAGLYRRRRAHRIAAIAGILFSVLLVGVVSLDIVGVVELPGMGMVYEKTGLADPNPGRAVKRVEAKLQSTDLDPAKRAQLEARARALRESLIGKQRPAARVKSSSPSVGKSAPSREGVKEPEKMSKARRSLAHDVFSDSRKREGKIRLAAPDKIETPNLPDGLTKEAITKVLLDNSRSMNLCMSEAMRKGEQLSGKMEIEITIAANGNVNEARIDAVRFRNTVMATCAIKRIRGWKFPRFNGEPVTVTYPYVLQAGF